MNADQKELNEILKNAPDRETPLPLKYDAVLDFSSAWSEETGWASDDAKHIADYLSHKLGLR